LRILQHRFPAFIFLIVVVMMNLLNGLAVSDTGVIRQEAEIHSYKSQVSTPDPNSETHTLIAI
jgi:hypothetical protein